MTSTATRPPSPRSAAPLRALALALAVAGLFACNGSPSGGSGGEVDAGEDLAADGTVALDLGPTPDSSGVDAGPEPESTPNHLTTTIAGGSARSASYSARVRLLPPLAVGDAQTGEGR